jgi:hypothetical protein
MFDYQTLGEEYAGIIQVKKAKIKNYENGFVSFSVLLSLIIVYKCNYPALHGLDPPTP